MSPILFVLSPLFGAILVGFIAGANRLFDQDNARVFSRFVFSVAMPVAVFNFMRKSDPPDWTYLGMFGAYFLALGIISALLFVLTRRLEGASIREAGAVVFAATCGNAVFLGLPIAISIPGWGVPFLMLMICEGLVVFAIGTALMTWPEEGHIGAGAIRRSVFDAIKRVLKNPIIIGHLSGMTLSFMAVELPEIIGGPIDLFGSIASPFGLFVLGLYLAILMRQQSAPPVRLLSYSLPIKLFLFPLLTGTLTWAFTGNPLFATVSALFTGMPPAVSSIVLAATYRQYEHQVAAIVGLGTLVGLATTAIYLFATI